MHSWVTVCYPSLPSCAAVTHPGRRGSRLARCSIACPAACAAGSTSMPAAIAPGGANHAAPVVLARRTSVQRAYLAALAETGNNTVAARHVGIDRDTPHRWRQKDAAFAAAWDEAQEAATEKLEAEAWRRAVEGVPNIRRSYWRGVLVGEDVKQEYSDKLLELLLKARAPHKYRETTTLDVRQVVKVVAGIDPLAVIGSSLRSTPALPSSDE